MTPFNSQIVEKLLNSSGVYFLLFT